MFLNRTKTISEIVADCQFPIIIRNSFNWSSKNFFSPVLLIRVLNILNYTNFTNITQG
jgi:hypothetical protein